MVPIRLPTTARCTSPRVMELQPDVLGWTSRQVRLLSGAESRRIRDGTKRTSPKHSPHSWPTFSFYPDIQTKQLWLTGRALRESTTSDRSTLCHARNSGRRRRDRQRADGAEGDDADGPCSYYASEAATCAQGTIGADIAHTHTHTLVETTRREVKFFDYIDGANGPNTAPNVDSIFIYGVTTNRRVSFLNDAETKRSSLNLPADATWRQESRLVCTKICRRHYETLRGSPRTICRRAPVLLYQGQLDVRDGVAATEARLQNGAGWLAQVLRCRRKSVDVVQRAIAGYYRSCGGLTHLTVNAAGHLAATAILPQASRVVRAPGISTARQDCPRLPRWPSPAQKGGWSPW